MKKLPLIVLCFSLISACSNITPINKNTTNLNDEESLSTFNTKALTASYLKKKLDKWETDNNGKKMLRELEYAKFKHIDVLKQVINSQADSYTYYQGLKNFIEVTTKEGNDTAFKAFIDSLSPLPSVVTATNASNLGITTFTANWTQVSNAKSYLLIIDNGTPIDVGNVTSYNATNMTAGVSHSYKVKSVNEGGISDVSNTINLTLNPNAPSSPTATVATDITQTSFTANWNSISNATSYKLIVDGGTPTDVGNVTNYSVTGLSVGSTHTYKVQASNISGNSADSNTISLTLNPAIPSTPVATVATDITQTSFTANWNSVSGATSYKLYLDGNSTPISLGNVTSYNVTALTANSNHNYKVVASNISGNSADSNTINLTLLPSTPVATTASNLAGTSYTANWNTVTGATSYKLYLDGNSTPIVLGNVTSYDVTGLVLASTHSYNVVANNSTCDSKTSNTINVTLNSNILTDLKVKYSLDSLIATDESGNNNNGTISGTPTLVTGVKGNAFSFNTTQRINLNKRFIVGYSNVTLSLWIKPTVLDSTEYGRGIYVEQNASQYSKFNLNIKNGYIRFFGRTAATSGTIDMNLLAATVNTWYHVVIVKEGLVLKFYINGNLITTQTLTSDLYNDVDVSQTYIGADTTGTSEAFNGFIDEFRIYNKSLTATDIKDLYNYDKVNF